MPNQIVTENEKPGTDAWQLSNPASADVLAAYMSSTSTAPGDEVSIHLRCATPQYRGRIYRLGWYDGQGGRELAALPVQAGEPQPDPTIDGRGTVRCDWSVAYTVEIPPEWVSGLYVVRLETVPEDPDEEPADTYVTFVVRDDMRTGHIVLETAVMTYQAYNSWGGKSLYADATGSFDRRALAVSFDRPYADGGGSGQLLFWEYPLARWLERSGYDVRYATNFDLDRGDTSLMVARVIISAGHDEYWTQAMRDNAEQALSAGVSWMFLGANAVYWRVRLEDNGRTLACYKDAGPISFDPVTAPDATTRLFRDAVVGQPEQALIGQGYVTFNTAGNFPLRVINTHLWPFDGTGLNDGDALPGLVGYEMDQVDAAFPIPAGLEKLAESPLVGPDGKDYVSNTTLYSRDPAWVFAAGTNSWAWGLDDLILPFMPGIADHEVATDAIRRMTANVLAAMLNPRAVAVDLSGGEPVVSYLEPVTPAESWLDGWTDAEDACLVGDFLNEGFDQALFLNRRPEGGRFMIVSLRDGHGVNVLQSEEWGESDWLDGWDDEAQLQLAGDFLGLGYDQLLLVNRTSAPGRAMVVDFSPAASSDPIRYFEQRGDSPWLDGLDSDTYQRLVGDFAGSGHDQTLFLRRG